LRHTECHLGVRVQGHHTVAQQESFNDSDPLNWASPAAAFPGNVQLLPHMTRDRCAAAVTHAARETGPEVETVLPNVRCTGQRLLRRPSSGSPLHAWACRAVTRRAGVWMAATTV